MAKKEVKRPNPIFYAILTGLSSLYVILAKGHRFSGREVLKNLPDGPFLVIGNHTSFYDFLYLVRIFWPRPINFIVAAKYFRFTGLLPWLLGIAQAIPKSLFKADIRTVARSKSVICQGGIVGIFPEGQISTGGITLPLPEGLGKLTALLGVPVYGVRTMGAGFVNPPWSPLSRRGRVESVLSLVLTGEEAVALPREEVDRRLSEALAVNSYDWQKINGNQYKGKDLTRGLENILYRCPSCGLEFTLSMDRGTIICTNCGLAASMDGSGHFHWSGGVSYFEHLGAWYGWQYEKAAAEILATDEFAFSGPVSLAMYRRDACGIEKVGEGSITLTREEYVYEGNLRGETVRLCFPVAKIRYVPYDTGRNFQIYQDNELHEFRPNPGQMSVKYAVLGETLHHLLQGE